MIYKNFKGKNLSALGMGCMRFPVCDGKYGKIDVDAVSEMVAYAMGHGVNYFDTAWGYHEGNSESVMGEVLSRYPRDSFYLATKFPGFSQENLEKVEEIFEQQLKNCRVDYFDFYLFHSVTEENIEGYLDPKYGVFDYLVKQKKKGRIHHLGFSVHATLETTKRFLDAYGDEIEFCQIQLNWLDWDAQNAKAKVELLNSLSIPIWVMEPVRGGRLANLGPKFEPKLKSLRPNASAAEWAFRYLQTIPTVAVTLSGMSNMAQLKENIEIFQTEQPLNQHEVETLYDIAHEMTAKNNLPCTACRYCTPKCPLELDIPFLIEKYNDYSYLAHNTVAKAIGELSDDKKPSACLGCRACESVCPQNIKISEMMSDFADKLK